MGGHKKSNLLLDIRMKRDGGLWAYQALSFQKWDEGLQVQHSNIWNFFFCNLFIYMFKNKAFNDCSFFCSVTLALEDREVLSDTFWEEGNDSLMV